MTQPSEWTTTVEKVTKIVTSWRMLVHEQNQPGRPPGPTDYINALASLPKEVKSEILSWFDPSQKTLDDLNVEIVRLLNANRLLTDELVSLQKKLANQTPADMTELKFDELRMWTSDLGIIAALPDHTEVSIYTKAGKLVRRSFTCGEPYKDGYGTWLVRIMDHDGVGFMTYICRDLAKVVRQSS